jgi:hypothetical protein
MRQIIWTCDKCGYKEETEEDEMPMGWIHWLKKNKVYHSESCMLSDMTLDEMAEYNDSIPMASPPDLGVKVSDGIGVKDEMK